MKLGLVFFLVSFPFFLSLFFFFKFSLLSFFLSNPSPPRSSEERGEHRVGQIGEDGERAMEESGGEGCSFML